MHGPDRPRPLTARGGERSVTGRALAVLEAFTPERPLLSLSDLSRSAGLPLTTTHRLVAELAAWGALERDDHGRYRIGLRLWEVASLAPRGVTLREAALPFMEDLYEVTHENVQLAIRDGHEVVFLERIAGRRAVGVLTRVGGRFPLHATGVGLALLAHAPAADQDEILARPLERFTEKTLVQPDRLRRALADVRRTGAAVSDGQVTLDALSVAAPVFDGAGVVVAALSIVVNSETANPATLAPVVRAAALGVSRSLKRRPARHGPDAR